VPQLEQFVTVTLPSGAEYYGGCQSRAPQAQYRSYGCGLIAVQDLLLCLCRNDPRAPALLRPLSPQCSIPEADYFKLSEALARHFPLLPGLGIPASALAAGLNTLFFKYRLPYYARWFVPGKKLWATVDQMLAAGIPVILSAGRSFPNLLDKSGIPFYYGTCAAPEYRVATVRAHFFTVTAADGDWLTVSSWGRRLYLRKQDFDAFASKHSGRFLSSMLYVTRLSLPREP